MPVRSLATAGACLGGLGAPLFYPSLAAVRANLDGTLGKYLDAEANARGWDIVAFWDEGMHNLSGLKSFDRVRNLKAREFLITRSDPVAERQFGYWKADVRRINPENRAAVLRECLIANRATTLQQIMREQLYRVHLAMSLTNHRYEGWVVIAPRERWEKLDTPLREELDEVLQTTTVWQRHDAERRGKSRCRTKASRDDHSRSRCGRAWGVQERLARLGRAFVRRAGQSPKARASQSGVIRNSSFPCRCRYGGYGSRQRPAARFP